MLLRLLWTLHDTGCRDHVQVQGSRSRFRIWVFGFGARQRLDGSKRLRHLAARDRFGGWSLIFPRFSLRAEEGQVPRMEDGARMSAAFTHACRMHIRLNTFRLKPQRHALQSVRVVQVILLALPFLTSFMSPPPLLIICACLSLSAFENLPAMHSDLTNSSRRCCFRIIKMMPVETTSWRSNGTSQWGCPVHYWIASHTKWNQTAQQALINLGIRAKMFVANLLHPSEAPVQRSLHSSFIQTILLETESQRRKIGPSVMQYQL